jgi:hypothetical protein
MTSGQIYALYISPFVLLIVAGTAAWLFSRQDRAEAERERARQPK